jgi:dTDP-4-dehydrorhamnose 3,5-epimerase
MIFNDERGYFFESFNTRLFDEAVGEEIKFVQDNQSFSKRGVLRGLHFQKGEFSQAKLVRVIQGKILDIVVDIRQDSPTFGKHFSIELS